MEFVRFEHLVEIFCRMVKKCLRWVTCYSPVGRYSHREEVVAAFWDLHGN